MSTPLYTTTTDEPVSGAAGPPPVDPLVESIMYMCALIADQPRAIDRYIDYFGERRERIVYIKSLVCQTAAPQQNVEQVVTTGQYL